MKRNLLVILGLAAFSGAQAQLFNNADGRGLFEPLGLGTQTRGAGGFYSVLQAGNSTLGVTGSTAAGFSLADDFTNSVAWNVTGASVFAYQTNATAPSITGGVCEIRSGSPTGALELTGTWSANTFTNVYRSSTTLSDARRVQQIDYSFSGVLGAGTHWLVYANTGSTAFSGPFTPLLTAAGLASPSGALNAMQGTGGVFGQIFDGFNTTAGQDLPFIINGSVVPEPASIIALAAGLAAIARKRRK
jgi:hypothetical protein